jgi:DNA-binding phage protein
MARRAYKNLPQMPDYVIARRDWEREYFRRAIERSPSMSAVALTTGMDRSALYKKLGQLGLHVSTMLTAA